MLNKKKYKENISLFIVILIYIIWTIIQISQDFFYKNNQRCLLFVNSQIKSPYYLSKFIYSQNAPYFLITTLTSSSANYQITFQTSFSTDFPIPDIVFGISKHNMNSPFIIQGFQLSFSSKARNQFIIHNNMEASTSLFSLRINYIAFINPNYLNASYPIVFHQFTYLKSFLSTDNVKTSNGIRKTSQIKNIPNNQLANKINYKNMTLAQSSTSVKLAYFLHGFYIKSQQAAINGFNISVNLIFNNASFITIQYGTSYQCYLQKIQLQIIFIIEDKNIPSLLYMNTYKNKLNSGINFNAANSISNYTDSLISSLTYMFGTQNFNNDDSNIYGQYELIYNSSKPHEYQVRFYNKTFKGYEFGILIVGLKQCGSSHWTNYSYIQCTSYCNIKKQYTDLFIGGSNKNNVCIICQQGSQYYDESTQSCELLVQEKYYESSIGLIIGGVLIIVLLIIGIIVGILIYRIYKTRKNDKNRLDRTQPSIQKIIQQADLRID